MKIESYRTEDRILIVTAVGVIEHLLVQGGSWIEDELAL
jgi:hypothetical protein